MKTRACIARLETSLLLRARLLCMCVCVYVWILQSSRGNIVSSRADSLYLDITFVLSTVHDSHGPEIRAIGFLSN